MKRISFSVFIFGFITILVFLPIFLTGELPIPSDALVGLYHPYRDFYAESFPNGIPFENFLITDPIRQQYPWRFFAVEEIKQWNLPLWNPYNFAGSPLLANMQAAPFYPLTLFFTVFPFPLAWSLTTILQPLLMGFFLFLYLRFFKLSFISSLFGGIVFALSGFSIVWMEWNTVIHTALWLPLILLSIEKIFTHLYGSHISNIKNQIKNKRTIIWSIVFIFSLSSSLLAGHLQTFFYLLLITIFYTFIRWIQLGRHIQPLIVFTVCYLLFAIITSIQWIPTFQLIAFSARDIDRAQWQSDGWFIPYEHLIQFIAPDFFGNPTTLNYWGIWNYAELVGYIGLIPLLMAIFSLLFVRNKKVLFFGTVVVAGLLFSLSTPLAKLPYVFNVPFLSTAQPTRLLFLVDFGLAILAAIGLDHVQKQKKYFLVPLFCVGLILGSVWLIMIQQNDPLQIGNDNIAVSKRNLILPSLLWGVVSVIYVMSLGIRNKRFLSGIMLLLVCITVFDLARFAQKFLPFSPQEYLYPKTRALDYIQKQKGLFRIMSTDSRILPPNITGMYTIQTVDGYDPLYLRRYAELIAASERNEPNISPPFGFNRIITPQRFDSEIIDLLGVSYVLSPSDLESEKLDKVFQEGETRVYKNTKAFPRVFFVKKVILTETKQETINKLFDTKTDLRTTAIIEGGNTSLTRDSFSIGDITVKEYDPNRVVIETENQGDGFLVFMDTFYPTWNARIDGRRSSISRTNYNFRGILVPKGQHIVEFYNSLF